MKNRLGAWEERGKQLFSFVLDYTYDAEIYNQECRGLWCRVIRQAVDEYLELRFSKNEEKRALYYEARDFLFNDNYRFWLGDIKVNLAHLLEHMHINIAWFRGKLREKEEEINAGKEYEPGTQLGLF